ncbi:MAG: transposase [Gammaproteobacteria bacterium]|nr:transposase [Gammaproteobacteria bacterium]
MSRQYKKYSKEFKLEAVKLAENADKPIRQIARELDIRVNQIYKWRKELSEKTSDAFPGKGKQLGQQAELTALKKANEKLRMENEILKKAAIYFAKENP